MFCYPLTPKTHGHCISYKRCGAHFTALENTVCTSTMLCLREQGLVSSSVLAVKIPGLGQRVSCGYCGRPTSTAAQVRGRPTLDLEGSSTSR